MLSLTSVCVSRVILQLSSLSKAYSSNPYSKDPVLLLHLAQLSRVNWEKKMGCLVFIPPMMDDDSSSMMTDDDSSSMMTDDDASSMMSPL